MLEWVWDDAEQRHRVQGNKSGSRQSGKDADDKSVCAESGRRSAEALLVRGRFAAPAQARGGSTPLPFPPAAKNSVGQQSSGARRPLGRAAAAAGTPNLPGFLTAFQPWPGGQLRLPRRGQSAQAARHPAILSGTVTWLRFETTPNI